MREEVTLVRVFAKNTRDGNGRQGVVLYLDGFVVAFLHVVRDESKAIESARQIASSLFPGASITTHPPSMTVTTDWFDGMKGEAHQRESLYHC